MRRRTRISNENSGLGLRWREVMRFGWSQGILAVILGLEAQATGEHRS
jgi:hypothetical protein